ncbi:response regulator transcription factor [Nocardioides alcanivorans]|uniref:response regulator transcription factor n=1 Tax=Nocardioides alcanivorans TaxID=2897352 RepID=UPI002897AA94|nr:response regulator transcription factor [Nocardioides alcanivorans]
MTPALDAATEPIRLVIVDDDPLVRSALTLMLGGQSDIDVVAEAGDGAAGIAAVTQHTPDVVLMDIRMPGMDGLEATRVLHERPDPPRVIVLTTFEADDYVVSAVAAGAEGFLVKDTPPGDIVQAVRSVVAGDPMLSPSATASLIRQVRNDAPDRTSAALARADRLTDRERDVALAVGRGLSNAEIARELFLSLPTVKAHVSRIFDKLQATNRVQIAICMHDAGLV